MSAPAKAKAPRKIEQLPETAEAMPEVSTHEIKPESNPFTSRDWRMLSYAWAGLIIRIVLILGGLFSVWQYLENEEEQRVERTLQLVSLWERNEYQDAQQAIESRLDALNTRYANMLGASPTDAERAVFMEQVGAEAMTESGGNMPLDEFRRHFNRMLYFLNRMSFCVDGNLCSATMVDGYFGEFAISFWDYFRGYIAQERRRGGGSFAKPLEEYVTQARKRGA